MILIHIQRPRGVLHVLYAGDFPAAKAWARAAYGAAACRFSEARWKTPAEAEYWTAKDQDAPAFVPMLEGPVAMKFVKEQFV